MLQSKKPIAIMIIAKVALASAATLAIIGATAQAHEDRRNMMHWHGTPDTEMTELLYPNGTSYVTINNDPTMNGSWVMKGTEGQRCTGDNITEAEIADCKKMLEEAADSGEPVPVKPGTKEPLPPEGDKPGGDGKKEEKKKNSLDLIIYENGDRIRIEFPKKGSKR